MIRWFPFYSQTYLWALLALGLAAVVAVAAFYPRVPSGVVVKGRIEAAELRKVYAALGRDRELKRREWLAQLGIRAAANAYYRDLWSKIVTVEILRPDLVYVSVEMPCGPGRHGVAPFVLKKDQGDWHLLTL